MSENLNDGSSPPTRGSKFSLSGGSLSRRAFLRRSGGATVAALVWAKASDSQAAPVGDVKHCSAHGSGPCKWVNKISVVFSSIIPYSQVAPVAGRTKSGRKWTGTMKVEWEDCVNGVLPPKIINVFTGGFRAGDSAVVAGGDTVAPAGDHTVGTRTGSENGGNCGNTDGFPLGQGGTNNGTLPNPGGGNRTGVEAHQGTVSEGCIVMGDGADWTEFAKAMRGCDLNCCHTGARKTSILIYVKYDTTLQPKDAESTNSWEPD